ncbi:MAG TPA: hypothetical protein ENN34_11105 [Deltaproteobacteria bacterium]|nr:hypothetical protein [Deltaproteobacteria bacterium]
MSERSGKKADLDKEGIPLDPASKDALDTEGIRHEENAPDPQRDPQEPSSTFFRRTQFRSRTVVMSLLGLSGFIAVIAGTILFMRLPPGNGPVEEPPVPVFQRIPHWQKEVVLDPFVILTEPRNENSGIGVLIAQVSLQTDLERESNVYSRLFDLRSLIYTRLSENSTLYSKNELTDMLRRDLQQYHIRDVAFIQFDMH